jgi:hypothetical protein
MWSDRRTERQADGRAGTMKLTVDFRNFVNAPEIPVFNPMLNIKSYKENLTVVDACLETSHSPFIYINFIISDTVKTFIFL